MAILLLTKLSYSPCQSCLKLMMCLIVKISMARTERYHNFEVWQHCHTRMTLVGNPQVDKNATSITVTLLTPDFFFFVVSYLLWTQKYRTTLWETHFMFASNRELYFISWFGAKTYHASQYCALLSSAWRWAVPILHTAADWLLWVRNLVSTEKLHRCMWT